jgi:WD40 repeat protein
MQVFQVSSVIRGEIQFSPDGRLLVLLGHWPPVFIDLVNAAPVTLLPPDRGLAWEPRFIYNGAAFVWVTFDRQFCLHHFNTRQTRRLPLNGRHVFDIACGPLGRTLYLGCRGFYSGITLSHAIEEYDCGALEAAEVIPEESPSRLMLPQINHGNAYHRLTISANGGRLAVRQLPSAGLGVWVWDLGNRERGLLPLTTAVPAEDFALSGNGELLAAATKRGLTVWNASTGAEVFRSGKHQRGVTAVACNPPKPLIATGDNAGTIFLWDHSGNVLTRYAFGLGEVYGLAFAPDGLRCAGVDGTGKVVVWDVDV